MNETCPWCGAAPKDHRTGSQMFECGSYEWAGTLRRSDTCYDTQIRQLGQDRLRLDFLQNITGSYTGRVICRMSTSGRGWRLLETSNVDAVPDVRTAIDNMIEREQS